MSHHEVHHVQNEVFQFPFQEFKFLFPLHFLIILQNVIHEYQIMNQLTFQLIYFKYFQYLSAIRQYVLLTSKSSHPYVLYLF